MLPGITHGQQRLNIPDSIGARGRAFVESLADYRFADVIPEFDSMMASLLDTSSLRDTWERLVKTTGALQRITSVRVDTQPAYTFAFVTCQFEKGPLNIKVVFNKAGRIAGFFLEPTHPPATYSPPSYVKADSIREKLVSIGTSPWMLHGALTVPRSGGPFPVIILVHGSGPNDRDETIGPNKPFRDLAMGLASRGIAVMRYEKRTHELAAEMIGMRDSITVKEETIDDALAAVKRMRTRDEIDPKRIFVLGHSLGGMLAPRIARQDTGIAGLIILAGSARPMEDVIMEQMEYLNGGTAKQNDSAHAMLEALRTQVAMVKSPSLSRATPSSQLPLGVSASYWLDLRGYNPPVVATLFHKPMLILQGQRDYQVTEKDYALWKKSLGKRNDVTFKLYPDLNHLFVTGTKKSTPAEYELEGHVSEKVITDIESWVKGIGAKR